MLLVWQQNVQIQLGTESLSDSAGMDHSSERDLLCRQVDGVHPIMGVQDVSGLIHPVRVMNLDIQSPFSTRCLHYGEAIISLVPVFHSFSHNVAVFSFVLFFLWISLGCVFEIYLQVQMNIWWKN